MTTGSRDDSEFDAVTLVAAVQTWTSSSTLRRELHPVDPGVGSLDVRGFEDRYEMSASLGEGGMGVVRLAKDRSIGRDVAMKVIRDEMASRRTARARFYREARVQGQLEHPSIVPVYDLGEAPGGTAFFTMKRVNGLTLEDVLEGIRCREPGYLERYSRRRLLTDYSHVCLAMAYVHSRDVVHRDLKPANIMLGDYGEVMILDWGLAKLPQVAEPSAGRVIVPDDDGSHTVAGSVLGSPGYMPPEQIRQAGAVDFRADIYALGAILFEILTLQPMHNGATIDDVFTSTMMGTGGRPSARSPERSISEELDAIVLRTTSLDPSLRPEAHDLHLAIERYLDGARDDERREEQANSHAVVAFAALQRSDREEDPTVASAERSRAMRHVNAALALMPTHKQALRTLVQLLQNPLRHMPPDAQRELEVLQTGDREISATRAIPVFLSWLLLVPLFVWQGVKSWPILGVVTGLMLAAALWNATLARKIATSFWPARVGVWLTFVAISSTSALLGAFVIVPTLSMMAMIVFMNNLRMDRAVRWEFFALGLASILVPFGLQALDVMPTTYIFDHSGMRIVSSAIELGPESSPVVLAMIHILIVFLGYQLSARAVDAFVAAERGLFLHAWQLRQLIPHEASGGNAPVEGLPDSEGAKSESRIPHGADSHEW